MSPRIAVLLTAMLSIASWAGANANAPILGPDGTGGSMTLVVAPENGRISITATAVLRGGSIFHVAEYDPLYDDGYLSLGYFEYSRSGQRTELGGPGVGPVVLGGEPGPGQPVTWNLSMGGNFPFTWGFIVMAIGAVESISIRIDQGELLASAQNREHFLKYLDPLPEDEWGMRAGSLQYHSDVEIPFSISGRFFGDVRFTPNYPEVPNGHFLPRTGTSTLSGPGGTDQCPCQLHPGFSLPGDYVIRRDGLGRGGDRVAYAVAPPIILEADILRATSG